MALAALVFCSAGYFVAGSGKSFASGVMLGTVAVLAGVAPALRLVSGVQRRRAEAAHTAQLEALRAKVAGAETLHADFLDGLDAAVWEWNAATQTFVSVGRYARTLLGHSAERWFGEPRFWTSLIDAADHERVRDAFRTAWQTERDFAIEYRAVAGDGWTVWLRDTIALVRNADGKPCGFRGVAVDVTAGKRAEDALRQSEARYRGLFEGVPVGVFRLSPQGRFLSANPALVQMLGCPDVETLYATRDEAFYSDPQDRWRWQEAVAQADGVRTVEMQQRRWDGTPIWVRNTARAVHGSDGSTAFYEGVIEDVTDRKRAESAEREAEDRLIRGALHDALTGLPNRRLLIDRLEHAVRRLERDHDRQFALLFLDLDRFKVVNDSLGHQVGDELLVAVARRLQQCVRPGDTVARFGGDEFAILLEAIDGMEDAMRVAERIQVEMAAPVNLSGYEVFTAASIGITLGGAGYDRAEYLVRNADMAMYRSKAGGLGRYEVFDRAMHAEALKRLQLETDLRRAVERDELRLRYQPIVSLATGEIEGFEALVRWEHPDRGIISPAEFIPVAEEIGVVLGIGSAVLRAAASQLATWQEQFPERELTMAVNLSVKQLLTPELADELQLLLAAAPFRAGNLTLEITESMLLEHGEPAMQMVDRLKRLGVQLHLDDFGTGYSSLSYLPRLPIDALKIDRSFVSRIGKPGDDAHLVRTIVNLARGLGLGVVAEGIETPSQLAELRALGCDYGQGYLFSRPLAAEQATALLLEAPWRSVAAWAAPALSTDVIPFRRSS